MDDGWEFRVESPATSHQLPSATLNSWSIQKNDDFLWIFQNKYYLCTRKTETTFCLPQTGIAQLVEHRSPKPGVGSSSLSSRAGLKSCKSLTCRTFFDLLFWCYPFGAITRSDFLCFHEKYTPICVFWDGHHEQMSWASPLHEMPNSFLRLNYVYLSCFSCLSFSFELPEPIL